MYNLPPAQAVMGANSGVYMQQQLQPANQYQGNSLINMTHQIYIAIITAFPCPFFV